MQLKKSLYCPFCHMQSCYFLSSFWFLLFGCLCVPSREDTGEVTWANRNLLHYCKCNKSFLRRSIDFYDLSKTTNRQRFRPYFLFLIPFDLNLVSLLFFRGAKMKLRCAWEPLKKVQNCLLSPTEHKRANWEKDVNTNIATMVLVYLK